MLSFTQADLAAMDKIYRLNLINSITGYKSANLMGTRSVTGTDNVAIFSSVTHLGSDPAMLGFVLRPTTVPRHTYQNLKTTGIFSVNHVHVGQIADAHHTSAKYPDNVSEFDQTRLTPETHKGWDIPFVKEAPVQLACRYLNEYAIKENGTLLVVASIEKIFLQKTLLMEDGWVRLDLGDVVTINGLDGYAKPTLLDRFAYARPKQ